MNAFIHLSQCASLSFENIAVDDFPLDWILKELKARWLQTDLLYFDALLQGLGAFGIDRIFTSNLCVSEFDHEKIFWPVLPGSILPQTSSTVYTCNSWRCWFASSNTKDIHTDDLDVRAKVVISGWKEVEDITEPTDPKMDFSCSNQFLSI